MKKRSIAITFAIACLLSAVCTFCAANCYYFIFITESGQTSLVFVAISLGAAGILLPLAFCRPAEGKRLRRCFCGNTYLCAFLLSTVLSVAWQLYLLLSPMKGAGWGNFWSIFLCVIVEALLFWIGIITVYCSAKQLRLKLRVIGILCGPIPIANLFALAAIIRRTYNEVVFESEKLALDRSRAAERICATRYPILMVHGVFFRDSQYLNYWGRIPSALEQNGATVYYGNHGSAASVEESGKELAVRIRQIVDETGCGKLNVIAHSKGGLDCRYAIAMEGVSDCVASLTTINTPHRGCKFADYLLGVLPKAMQEKVATTYNAAMRKLGDRSPDFLAAVADLTAERTAEIGQALAEAEAKLYFDGAEATASNASELSEVRILRQSVGSRLDHATGGTFPLNFTYHLARYFDGPNDGLVSESSFKWGDDYTFVTPRGKEGISHGDMVDLNRANLGGFDVREFYVQLVRSLKEKGV